MFKDKFRTISVINFIDLIHFFAIFDIRCVVHRLVLFMNCFKIILLEMSNHFSEESRTKTFLNI